MEEINVEQLKAIAKIIIKTYIEDKYKTMPNVNKELERIDSIIDEIKIELEERKIGDLLSGCTAGEKIELKISNIDKMIKTLIHELFHNISKTEFGSKVLLIEEGYVTLATAEAIRNILTKNDEDFQRLFKDCDIENLHEILKDMSLVNGYDIESSVVRCNDLIFRNILGIDSIYEYFFNNNGYQRLTELSKDISSNYGNFFGNLCNKGLTDFAQIYDTEQEIIFEELNKCDLLSTLNKTYIEMNQILEDYLIKNYEDNSFYQELKGKGLKELSESFKYKEIANNIKNIKNARQIMEMYPDIFIPSFDYSVERDTQNLITKWRGISKVFSPMGRCLCDFKGTHIVSDIHSVIFAYDLAYQDLTEEEFSNKLDIYLAELGMKKDEEIFSIYKYLTENNARIIKERLNNGENLKDIIEDFIEKSLTFDILAKDLCDNINQNNFWDSVLKLANEAIKVEKDEIPFDSFLNFYSYVSDACVKTYFKDKSFDDIDDFSIKMQKIFERFKSVDFYNKTHFTPQSLAVNGISQNLNVAQELSGEFAIDFIEFLNSGKCDLGEYRASNSLDKMMYAMFLSSKNLDKIDICLFFENFANAYINGRLKFSDYLRKSGNYKIGYPNPYKEDIIRMLLNDFIETYFNDEDKAYEILQTYPNILSLILNHYKGGNILEDAIAKKNLGNEEYEEKKSKKNAELSLRDCNIKKISDTTRGTVAHLYLFKRKMNEISRNLDWLDKKPNVYYISSNLEVISELLTAGYKDEATQGLNDLIIIYEKYKTSILDEIKYWDFESVVEKINILINNDDIPKKLLVNISKDFIDLKEKISIPFYITSSSKIHSTIEEMKKSLNEGKLCGEDIAKAVGPQSVEECDRAFEVTNGLLSKGKEEKM